MALTMAITLWVIAKQTTVYTLYHRAILLAGLFLSGTWFALLAISNRGVGFFSREELATLLRSLEFASVLVLWVWFLLNIFRSRSEVKNGFKNDDKQ
jgi:hypothetical protein